MLRHAPQPVNSTFLQHYKCAQLMYDYQFWILFQSMEDLLMLMDHWLEELVMDSTFFLCFFCTACLLRAVIFPHKFPCCINHNLLYHLFYLSFCSFFLHLYQFLAPILFYISMYHVASWCENLHKENVNI